VFVIFNATILTMETGDPEVDLIREGVLTIRGGVIESVGALGTLVPSGVTAFNAQGGMHFAVTWSVQALITLFRICDSWIHRRPRPLERHERDISG
jgi:hypothetical protein